MNKLTVGLYTRSKIGLLRGQFEEIQAGSRMQFEFEENRIEKIIGKIEIKVFEGMVAAKDEKAGDTVEEFGAGKLGFVAGLPV